MSISIRGCITTDTSDRCLHVFLRRHGRLPPHVFAILFIALTFFAVSLSKASQGSLTRGWLSFLTGTSQKSVDFNVNDLMLGTQDPFLWFLVPLFGVISVGICIAGNYVITILMHVFAFVYGWTRSLFGARNDNWYGCITQPLSDTIIKLTAMTA
jgi:hypothetical protein